MSQLDVTIYWHRRKIHRSGKVVDGFQAGFSPYGGGVTCEDKEEAIEYMGKSANQLGWKVIAIEERFRSKRA